MSDLFIGSNYRPNRPETVQYKPLARPGVNPSTPKVLEKGDEICKLHEKRREKLFCEKDANEKGRVEKQKEKITLEKDRNEKGCFEKQNEKMSVEKSRDEKGCIEKDRSEKLGEKAIWPPEDKGSRVEKRAEKQSFEKGVEKKPEKMTAEKHLEKGNMEKLNVEKCREKCMAEKHFEIRPLDGPGLDAMPSDRFFYKG